MRISVDSIQTRGMGVLETVILVGSLGLIAWGGVYLGHYGGRFDGSEFEAVPTKRTVSAGPAAAPESPEFKEGRRIYVANCQACHGTRGEGEGAPGVPPLDKSEWVVAAGPARLIRILAHAVEGPIKVAGKEYNNTGMLAWGSQLSPEQLAAVSTFIRQAWGNKGGPVSVDQIKAVLNETKGREAKWTVAELEKIPESLGGGSATELTPEQLRDKLKALPPEKLQALLKELGK